MADRSPVDFGGNRIVRRSESMRIGKHEWRLTLYRSSGPSAAIGSSQPRSTEKPPG